MSWDTFTPEIDMCLSFIYEHTNLCSSEVNNFFCSKVALIPNKKFVNILARVTIYFLQPLFHIVKRFLKKIDLVTTG